MSAIKIMPCLDMKEGRVVKGIHFVDLKDAGDPVENAGFYQREGADELVGTRANGRSGIPRNSARLTSGWSWARISSMVRTRTSAGKVEPSSRFRSCCSPTVGIPAVAA